MPWRENRTVSLASSPSPSRIRIVPSPYFEWRTRWAFLRLAARVGAGMSMAGRDDAGRGKAPGLMAPVLPPPAVPPKNRAMLSMEWPSTVSAAEVASWPGEVRLGMTPDSGVLVLVAIHEATNGLGEE